MSYEDFAYIYDHLMRDVPYEKWARFVQNQTKEFALGPVKTILDVGCGTGELSLRLAKNDFRVMGVDLSEHMLAVATQKAEANGIKIPFFQQNMTEMDGFYPIDCVGIFCDSLNYLSSEKEVKETFKRVHTQLRDGGLLLFDIHSLFKMNEVFRGRTYAETDEEVSYIWNCYEGESLHSVEHELSFFVLNEEETYDRYDEIHRQRTFPIDQYSLWLKECGFELVNLTADFEERSIDDQMVERIFFTARKI